MASPLENAVQFLIDFGFFDVILPFLLVFTIIFAVLEKTRILGAEGDKEKAKTNINSLVAFTIALFVVATKEIVRAIQVSLPQVALILIILISFLLLAGSFMKDKFSLEERGFWKHFLTITSFLAIITIFLNAFGWLNPVLDYIRDKWQDTFVVSIIFLGVVIGAIYFVMSGKKKEDILMGVARALVNNYLMLGRGIELKPPFVYQGATAQNKAIVKALEEQLKNEIIVPKYAPEMGAIGAAILAQINSNGKTNFKGFEVLNKSDILNKDYSTKNLKASGCENNCEIICLYDGNKYAGSIGNKCDKCVPKLEEILA